MVYCALSLGVGFAALNTGNNLLYLVFSLLLSFLVLSGILSESALRGIQIKRHLPNELYAGCENGVRLEVRNQQRKVAAFAVVLDDRVYSEAASEREGPVQTVGRAFLLRIEAGGSAVARYTFSPDRRGPLEFAPIRVSTRFPFGLFVKARMIDIGGSALAYPELHDRRPRPEVSRAGREGEQSSPHASGPGCSVSGLREFRSGDPLRRVHWKSSLKRRALVVLQIEDERDAEIEIELLTRRHAADADEGRSGAFEWQVSRAATEVVASLEAGLRVGLRTESMRLPIDTGRRQRSRLLSFLAQVEQGA